MTTANSSQQKPAGFSIFVYLCLILGILGLITNTVILLMSVTHGMSSGAEGFYTFLSLSIFHLFRDAGNIFGALKARSREAVGGQVLIVCALLSLLELFYNTVTEGMKGDIQLSATTALYFLLPLVLNLCIIYYFARKEVRAYLSLSQPEG